MCDITHEFLETQCNLLLTTGGLKGKGLSSKTVSDILSLIRNILQFATRKGKIILVTHDVEEALLLGDEVCVMAPGQGHRASRRVEVPRTGDVTDRKLLRELKDDLTAKYGRAGWSFVAVMKRHLGETAQMYAQNLRTTPTASLALPIPRSTLLE